MKKLMEYRKLDDIDFYLNNFKSDIIDGFKPDKRVSDNLFVNLKVFEDVIGKDLPECWDYLNDIKNQVFTENLLEKYRNTEKSSSKFIGCLLKSLKD